MVPSFKPAVARPKKMTSVNALKGRWQQGPAAAEPILRRRSPVKVCSDIPGPTARQDWSQREFFPLLILWPIHSIKWHLLYPCDCASHVHVGLRALLAMPPRFRVRPTLFSSGSPSRRQQTDFAAAPRVRIRHRARSAGTPTIPSQRTSSR